MNDEPLRRFLEESVRQGLMPGAVFLVERSGEVASGAIGAARIEPSPRPLTVATPFDLASLTKALVTAPLLALLEQDGALDLDAPLAEHLPRFSDSPYGTASLLTLAAHGAGLPAWRPLFLDEETLESYLERIARLEPAVNPGETLYSDLGYIVLGAVLEQVAGTTLDRLFRERIAEPLGLERAGFAVGGRGFKSAAATERGNAYEREMSGRSGEDHPWRSRVIEGQVHDANAHGLGGVAGHAGLFGDVGDLALLGRWLLDGGPPTLGTRARARLLRPVAGAVGRTVGWLLAGHSAAARDVLPDDAPGHTGFTGTSIWLDPRHGATFVLLTNRVHPEVTAYDFQQVRHEFHRLAARAAA